MRPQVNRVFTTVKTILNECQPLNMTLGICQGLYVMQIKQKKPPHCSTPVNQFALYTCYRMCGQILRISI